VELELQERAAAAAQGRALDPLAREMARRLQQGGQLQGARMPRLF
jgi:hypothetical protein